MRGAPRRSLAFFEQWRPLGQKSGDAFFEVLARVAGGNEVFHLRRIGAAARLS